MRGGSLSKFHGAVLLLMAALSARIWAAQPPADLASAFGTLPQVSHVVLSRSGHMLAWRQQSRSGVGIVVYDLVAHAIRRTVRIDTSATLDGLQFEGDSTLLMEDSIIRSFRETFGPGWGSQPILWNHVMAVDIASGKIRALLVDRLAASLNVDEAHVATAVRLLDWDLSQPDTVIMEAAGANARASTLFSVNTRTGEEKQIASGDAFTVHWVLDADGSPMARLEWWPDERRCAIYAPHGNSWRQIYQRTDGFLPLLPGFDAATHAIIAVMPGSDGRRHMWEIGLDGSAPKRMLPAVSDGVLSVDVDGYADKPTDVWLLGRSGAYRVWLDATLQSRYEAVARSFPGRMISDYADTQDGTEVLAEVESASEPPVYYLINFATHQAKIAGEKYPQLDHTTLGTARALNYQMSTGQTIHAQLFLPPGGGKNLPLVVLVPGGPVESVPEQFDWFAQYLAVRGYAVLRPDIGLDALPSQGGRIMWGGTSQQYAIDGVHALVQQGVADPHRVCIAGAGYGGYAALAGAAFSPATYACAVSINGISDLPSLLADGSPLWGGGTPGPAPLTAWRLEVGSRSDSKLIAESPVHAAATVTAPVLLIHEENDPVVPVSQSLEMMKALQKLGKPVSFVKLDGADHVLEQGDDRIEALKSVGAFLDKYLH